MPQTDKINNYMTRCWQEAELLLSVYGDMVDIRDEYTKLGYNATAFDEVLEATPESDNNHLTGAMVVALMTSIDNLVTYMNAGNGTNLYKLKR
jgi:hypothetical protein